MYRVLAVLPPTRISFLVRSALRFDGILVRTLSALDMMSLKVDSPVNLPKTSGQQLESAQAISNAMIWKI